MSTHDKLISSLSRDLQPVRSVAGIDRVAALWLMIGIAWVVAVIHAMGPIRPGAFTQLLSTPQFFIETLVGLVAIVAAVFAAFRSAVPGGLKQPVGILALLLVTTWIAFYVVGLVAPALEPSMLGKRDHCVWETFLYGVPPMLAALLLTRRYYPLQPRRTALGCGLAAGMLPALYMQIACMYSPTHILAFHIFPGFLVMLSGLGIAGLIARFTKTAN